jgi:hypothetical protein
MKWNATPSNYGAATWSALQRLRLRFQQNHDLWTPREEAHLRFLRWLVDTGRLIPDGDARKPGVRP